MRSTGFLLAAAVAALTAAAAAQTRPASKPPATTAAVSAETKKLYTAQCQACHGPDGKSPLPDMRFVGRAWKYGTKTSDMAKVIADGVPGTLMMPFKGKLTKAEIEDLARYVRSLDKTLKPEKAGR